MVKNSLRIAFNELYKNGANEIGDETDIDTEKEISPMQKVIALSFSKDVLHNLTSRKQEDISWMYINGYNIFSSMGKKILGRKKDVYSLEGRLRLIGFPKFKKHIVVKAYGDWSIGGDTGEGEVTVIMDNNKLKKISFKNSYACATVDVCERYLYKQFNSSVKIEPITGYCHDFISDHDIV